MRKNKLRELFDISAMIKVDAENHGFMAQRGIGAGFQSVNFADCRSPADVRERVKDTDAAYKKLTDKGIEFVSSPVNTGGNRVAFFKGPDNIIIKVLQPL